MIIFDIEKQIKVITVASTDKLVGEFYKRLRTANPLIQKGLPWERKTPNAI